VKKQALKSKFKCRKAVFYSGCKRCNELNGGCDYSAVMDFEPLARRFRCPICEHNDNPSKCDECSEKAIKTAKEQQAEKRRQAELRRLRGGP